MEEFIWGTVAFFAFEIFRRYRLMSTGKELFEFSSVRLKVEQHQLVVSGWCDSSVGIGLEGAC